MRCMFLIVMVQSAIYTIQCMTQVYTMQTVVGNQQHVTSQAVHPHDVSSYQHTLQVYIHNVSASTGINTMKTSGNVLIWSLGYEVNNKLFVTIGATIAHVPCPGYGTCILFDNHKGMYSKIE